MGYGTDKICNEMMEKTAANYVLAIGCGDVGKCAPIPHSPEIAEEFDRLEKEIFHAAEEASILIETIKPVLRPSGPELIGDVCKQEPERTPVGGLVRRLRFKVENMRFMITEARTRVEL